MHWISTTYEKSRLIVDARVHYYAARWHSPPDSLGSSEMSAGCGLRPIYLGDAVMAAWFNFVNYSGFHEKPILAERRANCVTSSQLP
jgi:hypothetical protein